MYRVFAIWAAAGLLLVGLASCGHNARPIVNRDEAVLKARQLVDAKAPWPEVLSVYKDLIEVEPINSEPRQKTLQYLLDLSLKKLEERKASEVLEIALELNKLIPSDFYIQNRIIGAYRIMAEDAIAKKNYKAAEEILAKKALSIRFDIEAMRTYLNLKMLQAKELYALGKKDEAMALLRDALYITNIDENRAIYPKEREAIEKVLTAFK